VRRSPVRCSRTAICGWKAWRSRAQSARLHAAVGATGVVGVFFLARALMSSRPGRWLGLLIARFSLSVDRNTADGESPPARVWRRSAWGWSGTAFPAAPAPHRWCGPTAPSRPPGNSCPGNGPGPQRSPAAPGDTPSAAPSRRRPAGPAGQAHGSPDSPPRSREKSDSGCC